MNSSSVAILAQAILAQGYLGFERTRGCGFCFAGGLGGRRIISHPQASIFAFVCANIVAGSHFFALLYYCIVTRRGNIFVGTGRSPAYELLFIWWYLVSPATAPISTGAPC